MRRRFFLEVVGGGWTRARSLDHALVLAEKVEPGRMWLVRMRVGAGDAVTVRQGVNRRAG